jgi:hypothetical protein
MADLSLTEKPIMLLLSLVITNRYCNLIGCFALATCAAVSSFYVEKSAAAHHDRWR